MQNGGRGLDRKALLPIVIALGLVWYGSAVAAPPSLGPRGNPSKSLAIIVNRSNPVSELSFAELRKLFMGERNHWPNGHRVAIAMLDYGEPERQAALHLIYRMDENTYQDHLLRGMFKGDTFVITRTLNSPAIVRKFVFNAPGAIGYLRASDVNDSVKVVRIDGLLPQDKNYRLQIDEKAPADEQ